MSKPSATVRIPANAKADLQRVAKNQGITMQVLLLGMIEEMKEREFFIETKNAYDALRNNAELVREEESRRDMIETTLTDGIEDVVDGRANPAVRRRVEHAS